ncbi:MAG: hypothetical protein F9K39_00325 [Exiguobacterium chiriqhucha]|uniref:hypothetical protein n=1 Tax=Exiguobacterium chiriqhucha TaxID=1385984 RepID=UPI00144F262D|nr:hypothetical protein [Exiguobacterium chiriqhucha]KAB2865852.1 MAG: hypothetical protein F9K39_00325 [Exiguobacterium chiriqhucha]
MLGLTIMDVISGNVPDMTLALAATLFYAWRRDVAATLGEEASRAIGHESSELALRGVIVALMIGLFVSFFMDTLTYSLEALMYYGLAFVFGFKGIGLWFFMPETTVETELN